MLLYDVIQRGAMEYPDRTALIFRDQPVTYGQLASQVNHLANALSKRGIGKGDSIAVLLPNCPAFTVAYYAVSSLGAICVPANPLLKPAELEHIWADSAVKMVFTATALLPVAQATIELLGSAIDVISINERTETPDGIST